MSKKEVKNESKCMSNEKFPMKQDDGDENTGASSRPKPQEDLDGNRKRPRDESPTHEAGKFARNRRNSESSNSTSSSNDKKKIEFETDPAVLARRQKEIDYGKNTIGYDRYTQMVSRDQRTKDHPQTPPKYARYSRRGWDGMVKLWRKQLHNWDPPQENGNQKIKPEINENS